MAKPDLYICHTAYQVMIDLLRTLRSGEKSALIISSTSTAGGIGLFF